MATWKKVSADWITNYDPNEPGTSWLMNMSQHLGASVIAATNFETWLTRYKDKLTERSKSNSTSKDTLRNVFQLRDELNQAQMRVDYDACVHTAKTISAARPAALAGVSLAGEDAIIAAQSSKRTRIDVAQVDGNDSDAGIDEPATPPRATKRVKAAAAALATPHKLVVLSEVPDSRKLKHKPAAKIVAVLRSTRSTMSEEYAHLVSKMDETSIEGNHAARVLAAAMTKEFENQEELRAFHLASAIVNDFFAMVRHAPQATLTAHTQERKYLVEQISPALKAVEYIYGVIKFRWVEVQTKATKDVAYAKEPTARTASTYNVDVIGVFGAENAELAFLEQSGGPGAVSRQHALDDSIKVANEGINATKYRLLQFLDAPATDVVNIKSLALQLIGNRLTLLSVGLVGPQTFVITEMKSARMPFGWKDIDLFEDVLDLLLCCIAHARDQEQCERDLRKSCRALRDDLYDSPAKCRDWL
ncbi:hypothetical protein HDU87_003043 [Geranomyces variabilis]|uniref:Uncharacterized protein n=1 Tax=Geranomyces variabilis TaxID=109894 RepID=A0AAD5XNC5_9FUNG|nr:hypothetical protein HDU87_003043 [Geranomyces variabilis]